MTVTKLRYILSFLALTALGLCAVAPAWAGYQLLHEFVGGANDGAQPSAALTLVESTLHGTTYAGGQAVGTGRGSVFKINPDGNGFALLHQFAGGANDGAYPYAALTLSGSTLYGTTENGGDAFQGTVFKINTDGTAFEVLHEFAGGANDEEKPRAALTLVGSTLYGTTVLGGDANRGTIFAIDIGILGDYNGDGTVDASDYVLWRGGGPLQNEVDKPGVVDADDYTAWRSRFGNTGSGPTISAIAAAPEPSALALTLIGSLAALPQYRRRIAAKRRGAASHNFFTSNVL